MARRQIAVQFQEEKIDAGSEIISSAATCAGSAADSRIRGVQ
jgi:hypothetical protein